MSVNKMIEELQKLAAAGHGEHTLEADGGDDSDNLPLVGPFTVEGDTIVIGTSD